MDRAEGERRLTAHLTAWLGAWPPAPGAVTVVGSARRVEPGWDGKVHDVVGVARDDGGAVLSVPPAAVDELRGLSSLDEIGARLPEVLDRPGSVFGRGVFRWSHAPTPGPDDGVWLPTDDDRVGEWLRPFNGDVLVGFEGGDVAAGVGRKQHDEFGHELAVVTEEAHRGKGWARRLVTQAARRVIADGGVPTYFHAPDNEASAHTAVASGFPDDGWKILGLFGGSRR